MVATCVTASVAAAATIVPNTFSDQFGGNAAQCSLREAVQSSNTSTAFDGCTAGVAGVTDTIQLQPGSTYTLGGTGLNGVDDTNAAGDLDVRSEALTIESPFVNAVPAVIDAQGTSGDRVLDLAPLNAPDAYTGTTLNDVRITGGIDVGGGGGGIRAGAFSGTLTVARSQISGNTSTVGGGIRYDGGGGTITDTSIDNNTAGAAGGVFQEFSTLTFNRSYIGSNHATSGSAGGISVSNSFPVTILVNTTVIQNTAVTDAGGIGTGSSTVNLINATVANNLADSDGGGSAGDGGGLLIGGSATVNTRNSIISDNGDASPAGNVFPDCGGALTSGGHNLLKSTTGCTGATGTGDLTGVGAIVGLATDHGGYTPTVFPGPGSPAIDAGDPGTPDGTPPHCEGVDQRNLPRTGLAAPCDIGAAELQSVAVGVSKTGLGFGTVSSSPPGLNCGGTCTAQFDEGTPVTVNSTPDPGSSFDAISGNGCSGTGPCMFTVDLSTTGVTASFGDPNPPVLSPIGSKTVQAGSPLAFTASATDLDPGSTLTYAITNPPPGSTFNTATGAFSWTPTTAQVGSFPNVGLSASDGSLSDSETIAITVTAVPTNTNPAPPATGKRAAALKKCKKKKGAARKKCKKKANKLPV